MRQKREVQNDFQIQGPYGSIRNAKTYSPNQVRYSENTESNSNLKPLTQCEETVNLRVPATYEFPRLPCRCTVKPIIYILFVFAVAYRSFYLCIFVPSL